MTLFGWLLPKPGGTKREVVVDTEWGKDKIPPLPYEELTNEEVEEIMADTDSATETERERLERRRGRQARGEDSPTEGRAKLKEEDYYAKVYDAVFEALAHESVASVEDAVDAAIRSATEEKK